MLARVGQLLKPAGQLLLATCCQGGNAGMEALNLWGASNRHGGRLPDSDEMRQQLRDAGYANVEVSRLIPGDSFLPSAPVPPAFDKLASKAQPQQGPRR